MEDLTTFYKTLRDIYKEDKIKKKKKFLEELIKNKQPNCVFCSKPSEILCEICVRDVHRDSPDLETTLFCDLFEQYRYIKKMRRIAVYEYLFKQVGSVYNGDSNESEINTLLRRLNEFNFQFNNLIVDILL
ncbi:hypothetical protein NBO_24g0010 [Nosema bombycis CQ1]|uniref:Uncharacterized protein n=1 Tax=Nosema bombycis (strain CQ1 / CVCC 102059) TaxID=578461 RepID=R0M9B1_NOSB1|nr:hypothetical protein NBO_24g0010 [Nosema bombycis CQ1]|eukprot:EOB14564.1 hypothetical protein NBO_24g0010 [Nosema bombycis CQ1]